MPNEQPSPQVGTGQGGGPRTRALPDTRLQQFPVRPLASPPPCTSPSRGAATSLLCIIYIYTGSHFSHPEKLPLDPTFRFSPPASCPLSFLTYIGQSNLSAGGGLAVGLPPLLAHCPDSALTEPRSSSRPFQSPARQSLLSSLD